MAGEHETVRFDGREIDLSHLERVLWPALGYTKRDLVAYYRAVAPVILPYLMDHPLTLRAFPNGVEGYGYYLRDLPDGAPDWLRCARYHPETREGERCVPLVDDEAGLVWYAGRDAVEVHLWPSTEHALDRPDWAVLDLDPGADVPFERVLEAALLVRDELARLGLSGLPKTSGGRGVHIFVPIEPADPYDAVRDWVKALAERLSRERPDLVATAGGRTHLPGLVAVDHAQNSLGRNTAAPYTARATAEATVSTPLTWAEVESARVRPGDFTIRNVPARLQGSGDPWASVSARPRPRLPAAPGAGS